MKSPDACSRPPRDTEWQEGGLSSARGFTLIETSIALVVMMVAALAATSLFIYAMTNNSGANDRAIATAIAQQHIEQLRSTTSFTDASLAVGATGTQTTTLPTVTAANRNYVVVRTVCNTAACGGSSTLKRITVQVTLQGAGPAWARTPITVTSVRSALMIGTN